MEKNVRKSQFSCGIAASHRGRICYRVPTVMENHSKSWKNKFSWKVMEKSWKIDKNSQVMEKLKNH